VDFVTKAHLILSTDGNTLCMTKNNTCVLDKCRHHLIHNLLREQLYFLVFQRLIQHNSLIQPILNHALKLHLLFSLCSSTLLQTKQGDKNDQNVAVPVVFAACLNMQPFSVHAHDVLPSACPNFLKTKFGLLQRSQLLPQGKAFQKFKVSEFHCSE